MEYLYFLIGWTLSLGGLYAVRKILFIEEKHEV